MTNLSDIVQWQLAVGEPTSVGDVTVIPQSQALTFRWPNGGFVWNRPVAVMVEREGAIERMPVTDVTRMAQLGLLGLSIAFIILAGLLSPRRRRS
jgi:hypothetical protein